MSQKNPSDSGQKGFAVGRGLLAAAETLNFSMNEQRSGPPSRPMGGMVSGIGVGGGGDGQDCNSQTSRRGGGSHLGSTMKLFASLGLSPADLDALAQIPEENISVETLPHILMQLKSRKGDPGDRRMAANPRDLASMSSESSYRGGREDWDDMHVGRMGGPSMGQASARAPPPPDFGYGSMQDVPPARGYNLDYGNNSGSRERQYSELSHHDSYGGLGMGPPASDPVFMQRRMGSPSHGKVQDFLGVMPPMFPHVCSLCDFDVHSTMEWNQHTNGLRHAENRRLLLQMYPDWDPGMASSRGGGSHLLDTPNLSAGLLGSAPIPSGQTAGGMPSSWGGGGPGLSGKNQSHPGQPKMRSRVVVAKYDRKPLSNKSLFGFTEPFGCLREHLVLKNKAFLEMDTHQEAADMVNYYQQHPATMYGKPVTFYLSKELMVIEKDDRSGERANREVKGRGSQVVFFSNLPREEEKKMELLTIAGRFGTVEKHLFLTDEAFVQLGTSEDAEMLVKYYNLNPLTIKGRPIRLNICTKYKTLNVNRRLGQGNFGGNSRGRRSSSTTTTSSSSGAKSSKSSYSKSTSSSSSSKTKEEKKKEEGKPGAGEEVAGVMEGEDRREEEEEEEEEQQQRGGNQSRDKDEDQVSTPAKEAEPESTMEPVQESDGVPGEKVPGGDDITEEADRDEGGAKGEAEQGAESERLTGPMETEAGSEETEAKDESTAEPGESSEMTEGDLPGDLEDQDILENMEDFVTLDELAEDEDDAHSMESDVIDKSRKGGMRVVNIVGFRRGYAFLNELLALAKPFGKVVRHLVLDLRPEAYLQFATEDEAKAMATFYNSNVTASVCGRSVRISHSLTYPTIQCGSSRVVYIGQIPNTKYSDETILKLAEPFGKVRKYFLNRIKKECFVEMDNAEDAEKMAEDYKANPPKLQGKRLTVYVSRKYKHLKYGHRRPTQLEDKKTSKRDCSGTTPTSSKHTDEPPVKRAKEDKELGEEQEEEKEEEEKGEEEEEEERAEASSGEQKSEEDSAEKEMKETTPVSDQPGENQKTSEVEVKQEEVEELDASAGQNGQTEVPPPADTKPSAASLPLAPFDPNSPIGVEHVKMGYYCRVCFLFYSNEETAKKVHCSSQAHYDKLKKHLEKEQAKAQGTKKGKKTAA